jgi:transposase-like protein
MNGVDTITGEVIEQCSPDRARDLTDKIRTSIGVAWELVKEAYTSRAWAALGYESWDHYTAEEFGTNRLRLPREERREVVGSLREAGLSVRAIAAATGDSRDTVHKDLAAVRNLTPDPEPDDEPAPEPAPITGTDGKTYSPKPAAPAKPQRRALNLVADDAGWGIRKAAEKVERLAEDDRLTANKTQVTANLRGHLTYAVEVCQDLLDRLDTDTGDER